eukprot:gene11362-3393_t
MQSHPPPFGFPPRPPMMFPSPVGGVPPYGQQQGYPTPPQAQFSLQQIRPPESQNTPMAHSDPWKKAFAPDGREYWYNAITKQTSWQHPSQQQPQQPPQVQQQRPLPSQPQQQTFPLQQQQQQQQQTSQQQLPQQAQPQQQQGRKPALSPPGSWIEYKTPEGRPYYYNALTKQTVWERPSNFGETTSGAADSVVTPSQDVSNKVQEETSTATPENTASTSPKKYDSKEEAEAAFMELLEDKGVSVKWNWDKVLRVVTGDPRFLALSRMNERKRVWNRWKDNVVREERDAARQKAIEARQDFKQYLLDMKAVCPEAKYEELLRLFQGEPVFLAVKSERERQAVYDEVITIKKRKELDDIKDDISRRKEKFLSLVRGIPGFDVTWTWDRTLEYLAGVEDYTADEELQKDEISCLEAFDEEMERLDHEFSLSVRQKKDDQYRKERKNRDAFLALLKELEENGQFHAETLWRTLYPDVCKDARYLAILGQEGSTALDLFKLQQDDLQDQLRKDKRLVKNLFKAKDFAVRVNTTADEYLEALQAEESTSHISAVNMKFIFEHFLEKAEEKERLEKKEKSRQQRRALRDILHTLKPKLTRTSTWEEAKSLVEKEDDQLLPTLTEEEQESAFKRFMKKESWSSDDEYSPSDTGSLSESRSSRRKSRHREDSGDDVVDEDDSVRHRRSRKKKSKKKKHRRSDAEEEEECGSRDGSSSRKSRHRSASRSVSRSRSPSPR